MKEVEVLIGIILIVTGSILFEMNWGTLITLFGLVLLIIGVFFYVLAVDSLDELKNKKEIKTEKKIIRFLPYE
jgi:predicted membrane channel-forming protein YqfA (hemolysin III family)